MSPTPHSRNPREAKQENEISGGQAGILGRPSRNSRGGGPKSRGAKQKCLRQIVQMRRARCAESDWSVFLGEAALSLSERPLASPLPNLRGPALRLNFFGEGSEILQAAEYAAFPHKSKHHVAVGSGISAKSKAWGWICEQITVDALRPEWIRRPLFDQLGVLFADLFRKIRDCRLPICIACWNSVTDLRAAKNGWAIKTNDLAMEEFCEIVLRNINRARVRLTIDKRCGRVGSEDEPRDPTGIIINEPSDDELPPPISEESLPAQLYRPALDPE